MVNIFADMPMSYMNKIILLVVIKINLFNEHVIMYLVKCYKIFIVLFEREKKVWIYSMSKISLLESNSMLGCLTKSKLLITMLLIHWY